MARGKVLNGTNIVGLAILAVMLSGCFIAAGGIGLIQGMLMQRDPAFSERSLRGLTRDEVIARLGKPSFDPAWVDSIGRSTTTRPWDEPSEGPYYLGYLRGAGTCTIRFADGVVSSVQHSMK